MITRKWLIPLALLPVLLLAACGTQSLSLNAANLPESDAFAVQETTPVGDSGSISLVDLQDTFEQIYREVNPSVVNIQVAAGASAESAGLQTGLGSGFVWDQAGHIVTNNHVIEGANQIRVTFADGSVFDADLVGSDPYSDLAVIQVDAPADRLHPIELADSSLVRVGQLAIAIGNPFGLQGTMTQGIVSGLSRSLTVDQDGSSGGLTGRYSIPDIIQTDASINPGNSGGVLVDDQARLLGVTSAIATTTQANSGVGFVIPASIVQKVVPSLIETGSFEHSWMGIVGRAVTPDLAEAMNLPEDQNGILVLGVTPRGPAANAGISAGTREASINGEPVNLGGDVITAIDGKAVKRFEDMVSYLFNKTAVGQTVELTILRAGNEETVELILGARPD